MDRIFKFFVVIYLLVAFFFMGIVMATEYPAWPWYDAGGYVAAFFAGGAVIMLPLMAMLPMSDLKKKAEEDMQS